MTLPRDLDPELLDEDGHDPDELDRSLAQVAQVNTWLGGTRSLQRRLSRFVNRQDPVRILDVGTGNGHTLRQILAWAERGRGTSWTGVGLDRSDETIRIAARDATTVVRADGLAMPFADDTFDAVLCSLTLHHFDDAGAHALLREMARVSRDVVLVSDLERSRLHHLGALLLANTVWRGNRLTRTDGPHSVLRSFTRSELHALGRTVGLRELTVERYFPWRLLLAGRVA